MKSCLAAASSSSPSSTYQDFLLVWLPFASYLDYKVFSRCCAPAPRSALLLSGVRTQEAVSIRLCLVLCFVCLFGCLFSNGLQNTSDLSRDSLFYNHNQTNVCGPLWALLSVLKEAGLCRVTWKCRELNCTNTRSLARPPVLVRGKCRQPRTAAHEDPRGNASSRLPVVSIFFKSWPPLQLYQCCLCLFFL